MSFRKGQDFIYPILNWNDRPGTAIIVAVGVTVSGAIVQFLVVGLYRFRTKIYAKRSANKEEKADIFTLTC